MKERTTVILQSIIDRLKDASTPTPSATSNVSQNVAEGVAQSGTWDSFVQLLGLVFLLIIILIATYYTSKFVGGVKLGQMKNSNFQVIDTYRISQNKMIQIVKVANKYVVIAIGKDTINYITELDEADVFIREMKAVDTASFKQTLDKLRNINK